MDTNIYKWFNLFGMILNNLTKNKRFYTFIKNSQCPFSELNAKCQHLSHTGLFGYTIEIVSRFKM